MVGKTVTSAANAAKGTTVTATAACAAGKAILGGGAQVTTTDTNNARAVLVSSFPNTPGTWTAIAVVADANLTGGRTISVTAYALCGL
ncbi:MAG: hypothetical protein IT299_12155 [Dehalococcoidia bacterium]|nr:hypothetical protein [Dehalococcoidia bacterium]